MAVRLGRDGSHAEAGRSTSQLFYKRGIPMLQFIMNQNLLLYVCGVACTLGVVSQFLLKHLYERLISDTQNTGEPGGRFLRQLTQRFQNCIHLNEKVNDISSFADRSMMDYQFLRMNLHQWHRAGLEALAVCLLSCGAGLWLLYRNGADISLQTVYSRAALGSLLLIGIAYGMTDNRYRHTSLKVRIMDYLQNSGAIKDYSEVDFAERMPEGMKEAAAETAASTSGSPISIGRKRRHGGGEASETRAQKEKRELKDNLLRNKAGVQEIAAAQESQSEKEQKRSLLQQMDPKEKEQILRDVLMEFLT